MAESLAVKYRPKDWDEVCGQGSVMRILTRQIELNELKNVYLFAGSSGCGKTTLARIFGNKINNNIGTLNEIDAASNNGVDNVKTIIKSAQERSIDSKYKIFIIAFKNNVYFNFSFFTILYSPIFIKTFFSVKVIII